jgi:type IV secretion system protein VirD4
MVSRSETARQLLTPGEIMQLPPTDEIVMVAGTPPIRAKKARYYEDVRFKERILPPPELARPAEGRPDDWSRLRIPARPDTSDSADPTVISDEEDSTESERRHQPELSRVKPVEKMAPIDNEFEFGLPDDTEDDAARNQRLTRVMGGVARQVSLDPNDGMEL